MSASIIDGKKIASEYKEEIKIEIQTIVSKGHRAPCLAVILVGNDPASEVYVGHKKKACTHVGIDSKSIELPGEASQDDLTNVLNELNSDDSVDGILLQLPLPKHLDSSKAIDLIAPDKDVDGLTAFNQGLLVWKRDGLRSCTPFGIMKLLEKMNISILGKDVCVLGRSVLVGAPIATMLSNAGATVTCCHSKTRDSAAEARRADIVIVATGIHHLVKKDWIKPGATVIDVGIHRHDGKLSGDVAFDECAEVAGAITPVPGGVGPMTIAMLLWNCLKAYKDRKNL